MIQIAGLNGPDAGRLRAVLNGHADYFCARVNVNGRPLTVMVALEGGDAAAPPAPEPDRQDGYPDGHWKPGSPQARVAEARRVVTGPISAEPS
jgi:hypothetical protein